MKKIFYLAIVIFAGVQAYQKMAGPPPLVNVSAQPYVVVYGRDSCSITRSMREALTEQGTPFRYKAVDDPVVADELHKRMQSQGLNTRRYLLPVVDVNGQLAIRPKKQWVNDRWVSGA